ncbi:MAG TPA: TadE family protein [Sphingomicrobium sp.]|nr:TadE family protein [Sphingomicrobium sp.]
MSWFNRLRNNERGAAVVELALSLPILVTLIYGIFEFSQLYEANAGMQQALGEGARYATLCIPDTSASTGCDNPADADITAKENAKLFGPAGGTFTVSDPTTATGHKTLTITYTRTMNFLFFTGPTITLTRSKQVYTVS